MVISEALGYAFISTRKAGTCTLYATLQEHYSGEREGEFHATQSLRIQPDWLVFTTCRNPLPWFVSIWWYLCHRGERGGSPYSGASLADLLGLARKSTAPVWLESQSARHRRFAPQRVLRVEHLGDDFAELPFVAKPLELVRRNTAESGCWWDGGAWSDERLAPIERRPKLWHEYLTLRDETGIREVYAEDFERLDYA